MPYRRPLLTLILTASLAPFLTPARAQPGAGSPPLGQPGQAEGHDGERGRDGHPGGSGQPGQPGQPSRPGTGGVPGGAGSANDNAAAPGAAVPKRAAPPL